MQDMINRPDDHEAKMARADLFKLAQYSFKLFKMIQEDQELEGWVQAKITKAADYVSSVYHYMQYEMKVSEYGDHLENAEMYSESVRRAFEQRLSETKNKAFKAKMIALREGKIDDLNDKKEYDYYFGKDDSKPKMGKTKELSKHTATTTSKGTQYTKRDLPGQDTADDADEKRMKRQARKDRKSTDEQLTQPAPTNPKYKGITNNIPSPPDGATAPPPAKKPPIGVNPPGGVGFTPEKAKEDPRYKTDPNFRREVDMALKIGKNPMQETLKGKQTKLDVDKDGKLEKSDFAKLRAGKNVKKAVDDKKVRETATSRYETSHQTKTTMKHVKDPTPGEKKAAKDIKPGIKGYSDRVAMLKSAEKDGRLKEVHSAKQQAAIAIAKKKDK